MCCQFRPVPFYFINTTVAEDLCCETVYQSVKKLKDNNFGGCVVFNKPPTGFSQEEYLSDKWFEMIGNFAEAGRKLEMQIWINDGFDFPPGDAGGRIQKLAPSLNQQRLTAVEENGYEIREVEWGFPAFEEPESSQLFIELVYEEYYKRLGEYFGSGISGFFSDTDCRRINAHIIDQLNGEAYFPWSRGFSAAFRKQYGYEIGSHLGDIVRHRGEASVRHDYWKLAGELYSRWFRGNYQWCREHGVLYSFHSSDTGPFSLKDCPRSSVFAEGSFLHQAELCDYPGTDHELFVLDGGTHYDSRYYTASASWGAESNKTRTPEFNVTKWDLRAKYTASAAYLYGRRRALCEAFAACNWGTTHQDLRRIAAWQIMQGINFFVPHAVHHKFSGTTKYFAPPEFLYGSLRNGIKEFNNVLANICCLSSKGELDVPIAVLDPTENVWQGETHQLFDLCDRLNRMPVNYIIVNKSFLQKDPGRFKYLILPGIKPDSGLSKLLDENGCIILNADELQQLPLPDIAFDGGDIHYMLRQLADGTKMLLAANIWSDDTLSGTLRFNKKSYNIELAPGEISVFGGPYENFRSVDNEIPQMQLPEKMRVQWEKDNIIPLPVSETFRFSNREKLPGLYLLVPKGISLNFDGKEINDNNKNDFLKNPYCKIRLQGSGEAGLHSLDIKRVNADKWDMVYLCGTFDAEIHTQNDFSHEYMSYYNIKLYMPEKKEIILKQRSNFLDLKSWTEQGAPFYSGTVSYYAEINHHGGRARLELGRLKGTCTLTLNGQEQGKKIWEPYRYILDLKPGINRLEIKVSNTFANLLECYKAESGLTCNPKTEPGKQPAQLVDIL